MRTLGKARRWFTGSVGVTAILALSACEQLDKFEMPAFLSGGDDTAEPAALDTATGDGETRDVEAPEVFQKNEAGLWDGRPSLGGIWVAHPDVTDPERVIIRNEDNGRFVVGALFRRERDNPGPALQVSSDAAEELGMLAGAPAQLNVVALRREEVAVTPPATTDFDAPADVDTLDLAPTAESDVASDASAVADDLASAAADVPEAPSADPIITGAAAAIAATASAADAATPDAPALIDDRVDGPDLPAAPAPVLAPAEPVSNGAAAAIDAMAGAVEVAASEAALGLTGGGAAAALGAPLDARGPIDETLPPPPSAGIATTALDAAAAPVLPSEDVTPAPAPAVAPPPPAPDPEPASSSSALEKPFIQVGIFSLESNADGAAARIRGDGMAASVREQTSDGTTFWRVVVGPAPNAADRTAVLAKVQALGFSDAYFVSE